MPQIELIVRLIIRRDSKILLCKNKAAGRYYLPGGHVEFTDTLEETLYKEMNEELGFRKEDISNIVYKDHLEYMYDDGADKHHELNMIFTASIPDDLETKSHEDYIAFEWIEITDIASINFQPKPIIPFLS